MQRGGGPRPCRRAPCGPPRGQTGTAEAGGAPAPPPPPPLRGARSPVFGSGGACSFVPVPRVEMFMRPSGAWITVMTGLVSLISPSSTRPVSSGPSFSLTFPVSSLRNGSVPNRGSSAISRPLSVTAGSGSTAIDIERNFTGRPSACEALEAIRACTRGRSTRSGTRMSAATTSTTNAATAPTSHFTGRFTKRPRLRALDGRQPPRIRPHRTHERPELLELLRLPRARDHGTRRVVHRVVDERAGEIDGHEVLARLLPGLGDVDAPHVDRLHAVRLPRRA